MSYSDFVNKELVLFSNLDNERSIPSVVDGFKPGQRKVMFTCLKRNDKREVKVAQLAGSVGEMSAYHHGEARSVGRNISVVCCAARGGRGRGKVGPGSSRPKPRPPLDVLQTSHFQWRAGIFL